MRGFILSAILIFIAANAGGQSDTSQKKWSFHFQQTVVYQYQPGVKSPYAGTNSLLAREEHAISLTSTFFLARRLWKNAMFVYNPEIAGGSGLSLARGVAGFPNGETFRVGNPSPQIYTARCFIDQKISTSDVYEPTADEANSLAGKTATQYWRIVAGKFSLADYFDNNDYSHDPRSQFMNWALMSNGAWDYAANVRGYTWGIMLERRINNVALRYSASLEPKVANGPDLDWDISKYSSHVLEIERSFTLLKRNVVLRAMAFYNRAHMGAYKDAYQNRDTSLDISQVRSTPKTKIGFGLNAQVELGKHAGMFLRASYNDGQNETWAFTEIDGSISLGYSLSGKKFKRPSDVCGIAAVVNGISPEHREYLRRGGYGFMVGDGTLTYAPEMIAEVFYSAQIHEDHFWLTPDFQLVLNPAYNRDRGPGYFFGLRMHAEF